jgi:hypothetical protein
LVGSQKCRSKIGKPALTAINQQVGKASGSREDTHGTVSRISAASSSSRSPCSEAMRPPPSLGTGLTRRFWIVDSHHSFADTHFVDVTHSIPNGPPTSTMREFQWDNRSFVIHGLDFDKRKRHFSTFAIEKWMHHGRCCTMDENEASDGARKASVSHSKRSIHPPTHTSIDN